MIRYAYKTSSWHPTEGEWLRAASTVSQEERNRIAQFMFKRDAKQSMMGRLLMRTCFSEITGEPPHSFTLSRDKSGKPYLETPSSPSSSPSSPSSSSHPRSSPSSILSSLSFNVSHAGDYAVFVGSEVAKVGVDVMKVELRRNTTVPQFFSHMTRQFTQHEWECIREAQSDQEQLSRFYRHWCLKESFVKCMGTGLAFGLQRIEFHLGPLSADNTCTTTTVNIDGITAKDWKFEEVLLDNHFIATAVNGCTGDSSSSQPFHNQPSQPVRIMKFSDLILNPEPHSDIGYFTTFDQKQECP